MAIQHNNKSIAEIRRIQNYYGITEHCITVKMVCNHAIDYYLQKYIVQDMMSYLYGIYEKIAAYGNDTYTRQKGIINMNSFDHAINFIDEGNYMEQLIVLSNGQEPRPPTLLPPPGFDEVHTVQDPPILDYPNVAPPDIVRYEQDVPTTPPQLMSQESLMPPPLVRYSGLSDDECASSFATPMSLSSLLTVETPSTTRCVQRRLFSSGSSEFDSEDDDVDFQQTSIIQGW